MSQPPVMPLPSGFNWGFVVGRSIHVMADTTDDPDRFPEARGSNGSVTFTPKTTFLKHLQDPTAFVQKETAKAQIINGIIIDAEGQEGIYLISGQYRVQFNIVGGQIPPFDIEVTSDHTEEHPLDLVTAAPYVPSPGTPVTTLLVPAGMADNEVLGWRDGGLAWVPVTELSGGGVTDHGLLEGLWDDDHPQYALADGTRGAFVSPEELTAGLDDKADATHSHVLEDITDYEAPDLSNFVTKSDPRLTDARQPLAHRHDASEIDNLPEPDLSDFVSDSDPRLSDARQPLDHQHVLADISDYEAPDLSGLAPLAHRHDASEIDNLPEPDLSDFVTKSDPRLSDDRNPLEHKHVLADITDYEAPDLSGLAPLAHTHPASDISNASSVGRAVLTAPSAASARSTLGVGIGVPVEHTVTVPNTGWTNIVTLSVPGLTGPHIVSPVTMEGAKTWAAGGWWASSPGDGQLTIEGAIQPSADPVDVRVLWWEAP